MLLQFRPLTIQTTRLDQASFDALYDFRNVHDNTS